MQDEWIWIAGHCKQYDDSGTLYINPKTEEIKMVRREFSHFNYHDEESWDESQSTISVEQALAWVYPNEYAISVILKNTKKDYSAVLETLKAKQSNKEDNCEAL